MPRANRCFLPDRVWHITHRCHKKQFLLKFGRDRRRLLHVVVRLGKGAACVVGVSMDKVEFLNEEGQEVVVDVQQCIRH